MQVEAAAPKPILMGRHLIELGMQPGLEFGVVLKAAFEAQLEGKFLDLEQAWQWLHEESGLRLPQNVRDASQRRLEK